VREQRRHGAADDERSGLGGRWAYWDAINDVYHGLSREAVRQLYRDCDAVINLCGATRLREEHMAAPVRIMVDTDPVYEQIKYATADAASRAISTTTRISSPMARMSEGQAGSCRSMASTGSRRGRLWCSRNGPRRRAIPPAFTTIATWENKGKNIEFGGETYVWSKHANFLKFLDAPRRTGAAFKMAMLPPTPAIEREVRENGWLLTDSAAGLRHHGEPMPSSSAGRAASSPSPRTSNVRPNSGWFSDRSVCYPRLGPAGHHHEDRVQPLLYPSGQGLFEFSTAEEIVEAVRAITTLDYPRHARAARALVEEYFSSSGVLSALLADAGLAP